jgi:hypothetical protein
MNFFVQAGLELRFSRSQPPAPVVRITGMSHQLLAKRLFDGFLVLRVYMAFPPKRSRLS